MLSSSPGRHPRATWGGPPRAPPAFHRDGQFGQGCPSLPTTFWPRRLALGLCCNNAVHPMLVYDLSHWSTFLAAAIVLELAPGPDLAFVLGQTAKGGKRAGAAAMLGTWAGALCHVAFAAAGLSAVVAASALAFATVKWVGVAYLLWLGIQALRLQGSSLAGAEGPPLAGNTWAAFRQGALVDVLNPKVAIFFLAFLPQFVVPGAGPVWLQLAVHGILIVVIAATVQAPFVLLGDRLSRKLRSSPRAAAWLDRTVGAMLVGLSVKLATAER